VLRRGQGVSVYRGDVVALDARTGCQRTSARGRVRLSAGREQAGSSRPHRRSCALRPHRQRVPTGCAGGAGRSTAGGSTCTARPSLTATRGRADQGAGPSRPSPVASAAEMVWSVLLLDQPKRAVSLDGGRSRQSSRTGVGRLPSNRRTRRLLPIPPGSGARAGAADGAGRPPSGTCTRCSPC